MNNEIKEILQTLEDSIYCNFNLHTLEKKQLLDYITNLQEERKTLYKYTPEKGFRLVGDKDE